MPYAAIDDLPYSVRAHLPRHAQEIFRAAFNSAWEGYASRGETAREEIAFRVAWAAVGRKYRKQDSVWVER
jgi:cation transport regulator